MQSGGLKALVFDDDDTTRIRALDALHQRGVLAHGVPSFDEAASAFASDDFEVAFVALAAAPDELERVVEDAGRAGICPVGIGDLGDPDAVRLALRVGLRDVVSPSFEQRDVDELRERVVDAAATRVDRMRSLQARYRALKQRYVEQVRCFEESQETYYVDLARMVTIISNIMDGIVFADRDGNVTLMNPVAEDLLAVKSFMAIGRPLGELQGDGELLAALQSDYRRVEQEGDLCRTVEVHHTEQDLLYIKVRTSRVLDYQRRFAGTLTVLQDVTAEYKTDQLKNQYLSIVAHELRTPLTGIKTFSTMMAKGTLGDLNDRQKRVVESMREQSLRLEHQIDKLINLGHLDSEEYVRDAEVLDFVELMSISAVPFERAAKDKDLEFRVDLPDEPCLIEGDRADLRRAVQALVENAVKFTHEGGHVAVRCEVTPDDRLVVTVEDDGVGIDPRYHRRIFEKFFQVEDPLTRHHGGAGLDLFFAQNILEAHRSLIEVESEVGQGARFSFSLPIYDASNADALETADDNGQLSNPEPQRI